MDAIEVIYGVSGYEFLYGSSLLFGLDAAMLRYYAQQLLTAIKLMVKSRAQEMASIAFKFNTYINYHLRKEMMRERERIILLNEF